MIAKSNSALFLLFFSLTCLVIYSHGFSECPNSGLADPSIPGVTDCLSWFAYVQSQGMNLGSWCQNATINLKCCLTCKNYQSLANCSDLAYEPDCRNKAAAGLCNTNLADSSTVRYYCQKSCGLCSGGLSSGLTCNKLAQSCNSGLCLPYVYFGISSIKCNCLPNTAGAYCQRSNACTSGPCLNGGTCSSLNDEDQTYVCTCPSGCSGQRCQNCASSCTSSFCLNNGVCQVNALGSPYCVCQNGYTGINCQTFQGGCYSTPCLNGGTCLPSSGAGYTCNCLSGYSGVQCQIQITNPCLSNPCLNNGLCAFVGNNQYSCTCLNGYSGSRCELILSSPCSSNPCINNGLCSPRSDGTFICVCLPGYLGTLCESLNACANNPCLNGGVCQTVGSSSSYTCTCSSSWTGSNCQYSNVCQSNYCLNNGICSVNSGGQLFCQCLSGFSGDKCQYTANCAYSPCKNGATCVDQSNLGGTYFCQCAANFYGQNCEYQVTASICNNGDTDKNLCSTWSRFGFCSFTFTYKLIPVPIYCPSSCNVCKSLSSCVDSQSNCSIWAQRGLCSMITSKDPNLCKKSCGLCAGLSKKKK